MQNGIGGGVGPESGDKRTKSLGQQEIQDGSRAWWSTNPMSYDWHGENELERFSPEWFEETDRRFIHGARLFATRERPFDRIIPFERLKGARVLEIGCGMGLHSELMARAGAELTSIDLSPTSIEATKRRLEQRGLRATVLQMDAEHLELGDRSFDFIWSWGVIHHSSRTSRIVREISRVLRESGEVRVMVYNREGAQAWVTLFKDHWLRGGFLKRTFDETLYRQTDGFSARYYIPEQFEDLFRGFFQEASAELFGQDVDAVPLPRRLRALALKVVPTTYLERAQAKRGNFIFLRARKPF